MAVQPAAIDESYQAGLNRFIISGCGCTGHGASERGAEAAWGKANRAIENREGPNARASRRGHGVGFSRVRSDYCIIGAKGRPHIAARISGSRACRHRRSRHASRCTPVPVEGARPRSSGTGDGERPAAFAASPGQRQYPRWLRPASTHHLSVPAPPKRSWPTHVPPGYECPHRTRLPAECRGGRTPCGCRHRPQTPASVRRRAKWNLRSPGQSPRAPATLPAASRSAKRTATERCTVAIVEKGDKKFQAARFLPEVPGRSDQRFELGREAVRIPFTLSAPAARKRRKARSTFVQAVFWVR